MNKHCLYLVPPTQIALSIYRDYMREEVRPQCFSFSWHENAESILNCCASPTNRMLISSACECEPGNSWNVQMFTIFFLFFFIFAFAAYLSRSFHFLRAVGIDAYSLLLSIARTIYSACVYVPRLLHESPTTHRTNKIHLINLKTSSLSFIVHFLLRYFHCLFLFVSSFGFLHSHAHTQGARARNSEDASNTRTSSLSLSSSGFGNNIATAEIALQSGGGINLTK